jgi:hypothetical protein
MSTRVVTATVTRMPMATARTVLAVMVVFLVA